jgi:hypothetical protein
MAAVLGLVLLAGILLLQPVPWQTVLGIATCQFGAELFIARNYMLAQVFVTPLALISTLLVAPASPALLLRDRIVETVIGTAVGIAVVLTGPCPHDRPWAGPVVRARTGHGPGDRGPDQECPTAGAWPGAAVTAWGTVTRAMTASRAAPPKT